MGKLEDRFPRYSKLLNLYPQVYKDRYAHEMLQTMADMLDEPNANKFAIWVWTSVDLLLSITKQQVQYAGGIFMNETPKYLNVTGAISGLLVMPFIAALVANSLDRVINNHTLYHSWVWSTPVIKFWVLYLPITALFIAAVSYLVYFIRQKRTPLLKRLLDIKHSWPIIIPAVFALGILFVLAFHDSVHCVSGNPFHEISNYHQTLQCIKRG